MEQITKTITADSSAKSATEEQTRKKEVMKLRKKGERGFTLVELFPLLVALAALAAAGGSQASHARGSGGGAGAQCSYQTGGSGR